MLPATFNLELYQGDDFSMTMVIYNRNSDGTVGAAVNLTSYVGKAQIRAIPTSNTVIADFTVTIAADQTANRGQVTLTLAHSTTKDLPIPGATPFAWDIQFIDAGGLTATYVKGSVTVDAEVSR